MLHTDNRSAGTTTPSVGFTVVSVPPSGQGTNYYGVFTRRAPAAALRLPTSPVQLAERCDNTTATVVGLVLKGRTGDYILVILLQFIRSSLILLLRGVLFILRYQRRSRCARQFSSRSLSPVIYALLTSSRLGLGVVTTVIFLIFFIRLEEGVGQRDIAYVSHEGILQNLRVHPE